METRQVICNTVRGDVYGGANCPFCGTRNDLVASGGWVVVKRSCPHAVMALDSPNQKTAIEFKNSVDECDKV